MKKLTSVFFMSLLAAGMVSCSSEDDPIADNSLQSTDNVYMTLDLSFPETRSATDADGKGKGDTPSDAAPDSEVGQNFENKVSSVQLILVGTDQKMKAVSNQSLVGADGSYIVEFQSADLLKLAGQQVYTYVVCNGSEKGLNQTIEGSKFNGDIKNIYGNNAFLMTNAEVKANYTCTLPANFDANKTKETAFDLSGKTGPIKVERAAARFDFKPTNGNIYDIKKMNADGTFGTSNSGIKIELTDVALTNQSNTFYYLRRVGDNTGKNPTIGGLETAKNYVVDTDWADKAALSAENWTTFKQNNLYQSDNIADFHADKDQKTFTLLADIAKQDNNTSWTTDLNYRAWAYTTENTSGLNYKQIQKGAATCIIFKGQLKADGAPEEMKTAFKSGENLYVYNNTLYGTWAMVKEAATANDVVKTAYNAAEKMAIEANPKKPEITNEIAVKTGFTVYDAVKQADGTIIYPVYYYYWNKHNDVTSPKDTDPATPMYYGVVRNNVYKLAVTTINKYGHPHDDSGDPDPIDPVDPIVDDNVYFKVAFEVLPWTVRVNNIEF